MKQFIELPGGDIIDVQAIIAIRSLGVDGVVDNKPRIAIDYTIGDRGNGIIFYLKTCKDRDEKMVELRNALATTNNK